MEEITNIEELNNKIASIKPPEYFLPYIATMPEKKWIWDYEQAYKILTDENKALSKRSKSLNDIHQFALSKTHNDIVVRITKMNEKGIDISEMGSFLKQKDEEEEKKNSKIKKKVAFVTFPVTLLAVAITVFLETKIYHLFIYPYTASQNILTFLIITIMVALPIFVLIKVYNFSERKMFERFEK